MIGFFCFGIIMGAGIYVQVGKVAGEAGNFAVSTGEYMATANLHLAENALP